MLSLSISVYLPLAFFRNFVEFGKKSSTGVNSLCVYPGLPTFQNRNPYICLGVTTAQTNLILL